MIHKYVFVIDPPDPDTLRFTGMEFHEELSRLGEKDGLKGRKLSKAVESFTWNITVLKVPENIAIAHSLIPIVFCFCPCLIFSHLWGSEGGDEDVCVPVCSSLISFHKYSYDCV